MTDTLKTRTFFPGMLGMPTINYSEPGRVQSILRKILVTGTDRVSIDSISVSGGIATCNIVAGFVTEEDCVINIANSAGGSVDGDARVLSAGPNGFTFATTAVDGDYTGTANVNHPGLGWSEVFTSGFVSVFKPPYVDLQTPYLRIDDGYDARVFVRGFESMSDVDTGIHPFPSPTQLADGGRWFKRGHSWNGEASWSAWGDDQNFYLFNQYTYAWPTIWGFGRMIPVNPNDQYPWFLICAQGDAWSNEANGDGNICYNGSTAGYLQRDWTGDTPSIIFNAFAASEYPGVGWSGGYGYAYPNGPDGNIDLAPIRIVEYNNRRGTIPGIKHIAQRVSYGEFSLRQFVPDVALASGGKPRALADWGTNYVNLMVYDSTGTLR